MLTQTVSGNGELVIPAQYEGIPIIGIAPTALQNLASLTSLTLPESINSLGTSGIVCHTQVVGAGVQDQPIVLGKNLQSNQSWQVDFNVASDGSSFNQWGSSLLATGSESLAAVYNNGFQLYLKADGSIVLKLGSDEKHVFTHTQGVKNFSVKLHTPQKAHLMSPCGPLQKAKPIPNSMYRLLM